MGTLAGNLSAAQLQRLLWSAGARTLLVQHKALVRYVVKQASAEEGRQMLEFWQLLAERPSAASSVCALLEIALIVVYLMIIAGSAALLNVF